MSEIRRPVLDQLSATITAMLANELPQRVVFLTGEAGIGKSTLIKQTVDEFVLSGKTLIAQAECSTPVVGADVGQVEALKPFADIMVQFLEAGSKSENKTTSQKPETDKGKGFRLDVGKFFIDTAPSWLGMIPILGSPIFHAMAILSSGYDQFHLHRKLQKQGDHSASSQEQVFQQYINFLKKLSADIPLLIVLDDFHWADASSANLLFAACRALGDANVVFVVAYRPDDITDVPRDSDHPFHLIRNEFDRYSMSVAIDVERISSHEINALIAQAYGDYERSPELEEWLLRVTDGNLLFATQFLALLEREGFIESRTARIVRTLDEVPIPAGAHAVVAEQIRRLDSAEKEQLRYASVEGETITALVASRLVDTPLIKTLQQLRRFEEQRHILRSLGKQSLYAKESTAFQFVHYLVHKALYDDLTAEERSYLHGIAADVLTEELALAEQAAHNVHGVAARLAIHASRAGRHHEAAQAYLKGAKWVWRSFSAKEALQLLDACSSQSDDVSLLQEALLLRAEIYHKVLRYQDAMQAYADAADLPANGRAKAFLGRSVMHRVLGDVDAAESDALTALELGVQLDDVSVQIQAHRIRGNALYSRGEYDAALAAFEQSLLLAQQSHDDEAIASATGNIGNIYEERGDVVRAMECHTQALAVLRRVGHTVGVMRSLINTGSALHSLRRLDEAMQHFTEAYTLAQSCGDLRMQPTILHNMGIIQREQGKYDEAVAMLQQSIELNTAAGDRNGVAQTLGELGMVCVDTNRFDEALTYFTQSMQGASELKNRYALAVANHNIGFVHLVKNNLDFADQFFSTSAEQFAELQVSAGRLQCAFGLACSKAKRDARAGVGKSTLLTDTYTFMQPMHLPDAEYQAVYDEWSPRFHVLGIHLTDP